MRQGPEPEPEPEQPKALRLDSSSAALDALNRLRLVMSPD